MANKLWGGRFKKSINRDFERFSASYRWDKRLLPYDLKIDAAHVKALAQCGVLTGAERGKLLSAVTALQKRFEAGKLRLSESAEDVHSAIQAELNKLCGDLADKIHTGRSRNDLVSQSSRLYGLEHTARIARLISQLQKVLLAKAQAAQTVLVPGMTHLQNAQVLSQAHVFLAYIEMLERAKEAFVAAKAECDVCVLGSGALAGSTFALDQNLLAKELGLSRITRNSYDVSGDRDFVMAILSAGVRLGLSLSRMAEDLMIAQTKGFSLADLDESFCTGSSMMPQKKNADFMELTRGAAGVFGSNYTGMMLALKGLPSSYNRDLQWDKRFLFETVELAEDLLDMLTPFFKGLEINRAQAERALADESLYATDLADYLVRKGVAFKTAHETVGRIVSFAEAQSVAISKIGLDLLKSFCGKIEADVYDLFCPAHSVSLKRTIGSSHPSRVQSQIRYWKARL